MGELVPGAVLAGYRIESIAGRGGMGVVYRATQLALERTVALKVIAPEFASDPAFRARFKRESLTAASIEHPNVIAIHDAREDDGVLFISMRYVEGTDLRETIVREGRVEPRRATRIVALVGSALDAAHEAGLVHRDVKPANVLLAYTRGEEQVYLTDFGLTKQTSSESGMTKTGMFVGTLDYVAPEQLRGGPVDARTDIYSLGCVLYQALTGEVPYPRDSDVAKMFAHASAPPPSARAVVPELPAAFDAVIAKAMAKDPDGRYLSAGDLGRAALAAAQGQALTRAERNVAEGEAAPATMPTARTAFTPQPVAATALDGAAQPAVARGPELPTILGLPPNPGTPTAAAARPGPARPSSTRKRLWFAVAAASAVIVAVVVVLLLTGKSADDGPVPAFSVQITPAARWAVSQYPGTRSLDKAAYSHSPEGILNAVNCDNGDTFEPGGGVPAGKTIACSFFSADQKTEVNETVRVVSNHPITFAPITAKDCFEGPDAFHKTGPCR